jgi:hypothetical protein
MNCKICEQECNYIFEKNVLLKYSVKYHQCSNCGFIQTDKVFWLKEAYENAITSLDIGILERNKFLLEKITQIIDTLFPKSQIYLDFAGGYGLFVRSMRDRGYNFFRQDYFCENIFAKHFDLEDISERTYDVVTAFEVFEHLDHPLKEILKIAKYSENIIFSTDIVPSNVKEIENWVYIAHETGQHIAFYTQKSLEIIAEKLGKKYYRNGNVHLFTNEIFATKKIVDAFNSKNYSRYVFGLVKIKRNKHKINRESYQHRDYLKIKEILKKNSETSVFLDN